MGQSNYEGARTRAIFYYRVGSGAIHDHDVAALWQAARTAELERRLNLKAVGIYTDFAVTRSTPWPARPAASRLTRQLAEQTVRAEVVIVEDPHHAIGPDNLPAALKAIGIPLCTPGDVLLPVDGGDPVHAIAARMSAPTGALRRARPFPVSDRRR